MKHFKLSSWLNGLTLGCVVMTGCALPETSVRQEESLVRFQKLPISYKIASTIPSELRGDIQAGFEEWNRRLNREVFSYAGIKELSEGQLDPAYTFDENVVLATNRSGELSEGQAESQGPLARTFLKGVSTISDADVYLFNFEKNFIHGTDEYGDVYSIQSVVMHEAGHMLFGPEHSSNENSIMTAVLYPKGHLQEKLTLGECDIEKFEQVYNN